MRKLSIFVIIVIAALSLGWTVQAQEEDGQAYVIQRGDSLWGLAAQHLGDGNVYPQIITATNAKAATDSSFGAIGPDETIVPGQKIWIPTAGGIIDATPSEVPPSQPPAQVSTGDAPMPGGQIAFSFWNNSPERCTYETNIIQVDVCLADAAQCQETRRIMSLNNISEPALSPDGTRLAFRGWGEPSSEDSEFYGCATPIPFRYIGHTTLNGTEFIGTGGFWEDSHPDWSPDGERILFDTARNNDGITRIIVIDADGTDEGELQIAGQQPSWAPDNHSFVYRGCDETGNRCGLWLATATPLQPWESGANLMGPILEEAEASHPDWSPVADEIVYQSPVSGSWDVYIISADGTDSRQLTTGEGVEGLPVWSPDGQWIAYLAHNGGPWELRIIRADGTGDQRVFTYDGGIYQIPIVEEPYGVRDWLDEQISWAPNPEVGSMD